MHSLLPFALRVSRDTVAEQLNRLLPHINLPSLADLAQKQASADKNVTYAGLDGAAHLLTAQLPASVELRTRLDQPNGYGSLDSSGRVLDSVVPASVERQANKNQANGYAGLDGSGALSNAAIPATVERQANKNQANGYAGLDGSGRLFAAAAPPSIETTTTRDVANGHAGLDGAGRLQAVPTTLQLVADKSQANGYCSLDASALVPLSALPTDVELTANKGAANGYVPLDGTGKVPGVFVPGPTALATLTDVAISSPLEGDGLVWNGSAFANSPEAAAKKIGRFPTSMTPNGMCVGLISSDLRTLYISYTAAWQYSAAFVTSAETRKFFAVDFFDGTTRQSPTAQISRCFILGQSVYTLFDDHNLWFFGLATNGESIVNGTTAVYSPILLANVHNFWAPTTSYNQSYSWFFINVGNSSLQVKGQNNAGQLGAGSLVNQNSYATLAIAPNTVLDIWCCGNYYGQTFIQKTDLTILVAGWNGSGQCGNGTTSTLSSFTDVTANWGVSAPIVQLVGGVADPGVSTAGFIIMHKRLAGVDHLYMAGNGLFSGTPAQVGNTTISTPLEISLAFLGVGETVSTVSTVGSGTASSRVFLLTSLGNLYLWGQNLTCSATIAAPTLQATDVSAIYGNGNTGWATSSGVPVFISKNGNTTLWVAGVNTTLPIRQAANATSFVECAISLPEGATIVDARSVGTGTVWTSFVLDSAGNVYVAGSSDATFFSTLEIDATVLRQFTPITRFLN